PCLTTRPSCSPPPSRTSTTNRLCCFFPTAPSGGPAFTKARRCASTSRSPRPRARRVKPTPRSTARPPMAIRIRSRSGGPTASATDPAARALRARISPIETDRNFEPRAHDSTRDPARPNGANAAGDDDFAALLAAIRAGDPRAEERLFTRFGRPVALLLDRHTRGRDEQEDLFQDTFRLLLEKLRRGEVREPEKLPGYVAHLAKNLATEHYRKAARRKTDPAPPEDLDRPTMG